MIPCYVDRHIDKIICLHTLVDIHQRLCAALCVGAHDLPLLLVQRCILEQDLIRYQKFSDIVKPGARLDRIDEVIRHFLLKLRVELHSLGEDPAVVQYVLVVGIRHVLPALHEPCQCRHDIFLLDPELLHLACDHKVQLLVILLQILLHRVDLEVCGDAHLHLRLVKGLRDIVHCAELKSLAEIGSRVHR